MLAVTRNAGVGTQPKMSFRIFADTADKVAAQPIMGCIKTLDRIRRQIHYTKPVCKTDIQLSVRGRKEGTNLLGRDISLLFKSRTDSTICEAKLFKSVYSS